MTGPARCIDCSSDVPTDAVYCPTCGGAIAPARPGRPLRDTAIDSDDGVEAAIEFSIDTAVADDTSTLPELSDRYEPLARIGGGGHGDVYLAKHRALEHHVAVKVLHAKHAARTNRRRRFVREARTLATLRHPATVRIYDVGRTADGAPFLVMELVEGTPMSRVETPLELRRGLTLLRQIAGALAEAHAAGIIHRDLKAENVIISEIEGDEHARLMDFGIARHLGDDARLTTGGVRLGTPYAMSPEQIRGEQVDARSDIYSFGVLAYELLTGHLPYPGGDTSTLIDHHLNTQPTRPTHWRYLPPALERLLVECLAKSPDARPESMRAVRERLDRVLARHDA